MALLIQSTFDPTELGMLEGGDSSCKRINRGPHTFYLGQAASEILRFFSEPRSVDTLRHIRNTSSDASQTLDHLLYLDLITTTAWRGAVRRGVIEKPHRQPFIPQTLVGILEARNLMFGCSIDFARDPPYSSFSGPNLLRRQSTASKRSLGLTDQGDLVSHTDEGIYQFGHRISFNTWRSCLTGKIPIMIGGDHSLSFFAVRGCAAAAGQLTYIQLDAHNDIGRSAAGVVPGGSRLDLGLQELNHANFAYRLALRPEISKVIQIGVRPSQIVDSSSLAAKTRKIKQITSTETERLEADEIAEMVFDVGSSIYLSIDLDVIDPSFGLSVTTPLDNGIGPAKLLGITQCLVGRGNLVGADLVEFFSSEEPARRERTASVVQDLIEAMHRR